MKFPEILLIQYKLSDIAEVTALQQFNSSELRGKIDILIIDDEEFAAEQYLLKNGFRITHKTDVDTIRDVESYAVILCDIRGVGKKLGSAKEGAFIIKEIKARYPNKQVIAYTGSSYDPVYNDYMKFADNIISKGLPVDDWISVIDQQIKNAVDPHYQWECLRKYLLNCGVSTAYVAKLEDKYVKAIKNKDFKELSSLADNTNEQARGVIIDFTSSVCAKLITGKL